MRPGRAALIAVAALAGCQKEGARLEPPRAPTTRLSTPRAIRVDPAAERTASLSKSVPIGTAAAEAQRVMEQAGYSCQRRVGRVPGPGGAGVDHLYCYRWENPGASSMSPADWGTRHWHVYLALEAGAVKRLQIELDTDRFQDTPLFPRR
jgi:hypothetical protein